MAGAHCASVLSRCFLRGTLSSPPQPCPASTGSSPGEVGGPAAHSRRSQLDLGWEAEGKGKTQKSRHISQASFKDARTQVSGAFSKDCATLALSAMPVGFMEKVACYPAF